MLKLNAGFSRKVGEPSYGSRGASVNVELELESHLIGDPAALLGRINSLFSLARQAGELALDTKQAYYEAVAAQNLRELAQQSVTLLTRSYEATKTMRETGTGSSLDENLQRGELLQAQLALREAELSPTNTKRRLAKLLSVDREFAGVTLTDPLPEAADSTPAADELIALARDKRLDLQALAAQVRAGDAAIALEYLRIFPGLSVGVAAERIESRGLPGRDIAADFARASVRAGQLTVPDIQTRGERGVERAQEIEWKVGPNIVLTLPIFDQNQAQIARADLARTQAVKSYDDLYLNIAQDIRIAVDQARTLWWNFEFYQRELLPQSERNLEYTEAAWKAGTVDVLMLLDAQRSLLETRRSYVLVHAQAARALTDLERAVGVPLDAMNTDSSSQARSVNENDEVK
jgi:cobalt-zinc-cadmium efflux system outer membrane protein